MSLALADLRDAIPRGQVAAAVALVVAAAGVALAVPWVVGQGAAALGQRADDLHLILLALVGLLAARLALEFGATVLTGAARYATIAALRSAWHARVLTIPPGAEGDERRQDWVSLLSYDIPRVAEVLVDVPVRLMQAVVTLSGALLLMLAIHPVLTGVVFVTAPLGYLGARLAVGALRERARRYWDLEVEAMAEADRAFRSSWAIQAFGQEARFQHAFDARVVSARDAGLAHLRLLAVVGPATQFIAFCGMVLIVYVASTGLGGELAAPQLLTFVLYGLLLSAPLRAFADAWSAWQENGATLGRFDAIASLEADAPDGVRRLDAPRGELEVEALTFGWRSELLFRQTSMRIAAGERVALVGANGAGKTTLVALLLGFVRPRAGVLRLDGVPIDEFTVASRRAAFAVVPQQGALYPGTIRENIAFVRPDSTESEIRDALALAGGLEFVDELPQGLDTRIGEDGVLLSGGQRQRVAIARALMTRAPILILDEATSGYDREAAEGFAARLGELPHRTVIWITHDAAVGRHVDRVVRLEAGELHEEPTSGNRPPPSAYSDVDLSLVGRN